MEDTTRSTTGSAVAETLVFTEHGSQVVRTSVRTLARELSSGDRGIVFDLSAIMGRPAVYLSLTHAPTDAPTLAAKPRKAPRGMGPGTWTGAEPGTRTNPKHTRTAGNTPWPRTPRGGIKHVDVRCDIGMGCEPRIAGKPFPIATILEYRYDRAHPARSLPLDRAHRPGRAPVVGPSPKQGDTDPAPVSVRYDRTAEALPLPSMRAAPTPKQAAQGRLGRVLCKRFMLPGAPLALPIRQ